MNTVTLLLLLGSLLLAERFPAWIKDVQPAATRGRWASNAAMFLLSICVGLFLPYSAISVSQDLTDGILRSFELPSVMELIAAFLLLDLSRYWTHRIFHEIPWLWRLHRVHHTDEYLDASTSRRHHPLEGIVSTLFSAILLFAFGFSAASLAFYFAISVIVSVINHTRLHWPAWLDVGLRHVVATPAVHYLHHSARREQTDSNYAQVLTIWDRLFGTWTDPVHNTVERVGLDEYRGDDEATVLRLLTQPFRSGSEGPAAGGYAEKHTASAIQESSATWRLKRHIGLSASRTTAMTLLAAAALAALMWPSIIHLTGLWLNTSAYHYALLVLPLFVYLAVGPWRETIAELTLQPSSVGILVVAIAITGWVVASSADFKAGEHLALIFSLQGLLLFRMGLQAYRTLLPLMGLLFFMFPSGDLLIEPLRQLTAHWLLWTTPLFADGVALDGQRLLVGSHAYRIVADCAGLPATLFAGFLGYGFGLMLHRTLAPTIALGLACAGLGIASNLVRVSVIVFVDNRSGVQMPMDSHETVQSIALALLMVSILTAVTILARRAQPQGRNGIVAQELPA